MELFRGSSLTGCCKYTPVLRCLVNTDNRPSYQGYTPSLQYQNPPPVVVGWSIPEDLDIGFIAPDAFATSDVICHKGATNAGTSAKVAAGGTVELQWTIWPESHHGPVIGMGYALRILILHSNMERLPRKLRW
jgi:hypothetical protein